MRGRQIVATDLRFAFRVYNNCIKFNMSKVYVAAEPKLIAYQRFHYKVAFKAIASSHIQVFRTKYSVLSSSSSTVRPFVRPYVARPLVRCSIRPRRSPVVVVVVKYDIGTEIRLLQGAQKELDAQSS